MEKHERTSVYGDCGMRIPHGKHTFETGVVDIDGFTCMQECPGQYSNCQNCGDIGCMGCVCREYDHTCEWDCPNCTEEEANEYREKMKYV